MGLDKKLTVVISLISEGSLQNTLESIFRKNPEIASQTEAIILDFVNSEESRCECRKALENFSDCEVILKEANRHRAVHYNEEALSAKGKNIAFISAGEMYTDGAVQKAVKMFEEKQVDVVSVRPVFIDMQGNTINYAIAPQKTKRMNVFNETKNMQFQLKGYFFKRDIFQTIQFQEDMGIEFPYIFLMKLFLKKPEYFFLANDCLKYYIGEEDDFSTNLYQYQMEWYSWSVRPVLTPFVRDYGGETYEQRRFVMACVLYLMYAKFHCNSNDRNKNMLDREQLSEFLKNCQELLMYIDEDIILQKITIGTYNIPRSLKFFFIRLKTEKLGVPYRIIDMGSDFAVKINRPEKLGGVINEFEKLSTIKKISRETVLVHAINLRNSCLEIDAVTTLSDFLDADQIQIFAEIDGQRIDITPTQAYPLLKCFGVTYARKFPFHISIPLDKEKRKQQITFYLIVNGRKCKLGLSFPKAAGRLSNAIPGHGYWEYAPNCILYRYQGSLWTLKTTALRKLVRELKLCREIMKKCVDKKTAHDAVKLRVLYHLAKPFYKNKRIWLTFDKIYKAGDNGEYMYHYLHEHQKNIKIFYVIQKDSPDYERMKANGENILIHESLKCQLMALLSETVLATHATIISYCGLPKKIQPYIRDLFNAELVCIQHGLTIQKIAQYQGRTFDNTNFYCCASKYEVQNIMHPIYDYRKSDISLVGMARYDGLKNNDQKQILITPTWRRDVVNSGIAYVKKTHNTHFKDSEYYRIYNGLINDAKLISCAKECGYRIIYLLHPAMSAQSVDYERNDYVQIVEATGNMSYEKILTESSLMVTDYSGVQFDFAYMRKPILYYHPDTLPPHYEAGGLIYETMGFGPICQNHEEIVENLCEYMKNQCKMKEMYVKRADDFFAYDDFENCHRIYEAVENYMDETKRGKMNGYC